MSEATRVLVVDDHELFRLGVVEALQRGGFVIVGEAADAAAAVRLARTLLPDVVLLDLVLPDRSGLELVSEIHRDCPASRIVVLTVNEDEAALLQAMREGASAYILKGIASNEFLGALRAVLRGETYVSPKLAGQLLREMDRHGPDGTALGELTAREREVLEGLARGDTNREIGQRLGLSEKTVKFHVTNVLIKLHVRNRVEAALLAQREQRR